MPSSVSLSKAWQENKRATVGPTGGTSERNILKKARTFNCTYSKMDVDCFVSVFHR